MKKGTQFLLLFTICFSSVNAQSLDWAVQMGGSFSDQADDIAVDNSGNVFTVGTHISTADFNPGSGTANLAGGSVASIFISKLDPNGNYLWAKGIVENNTLYPQSIDCDPTGNVYITGHFTTGTVDFDPGVGVFNLTSNGVKDIFVLKLAANGDFLWAVNIGDAQDDLAYALDVDDNGNVYVTGNIYGNVDFDPGAGTDIITGNKDIFILKLDTDGNYLWAKVMFGGAASDYGFGIEADNAGHVYTVGYYKGTVDFDPNAGVANLSGNGSKDVFISKLTEDGNYVWAKSFNATGDVQAKGIALDKTDGIYTTGILATTADFDPGAGVFNVGTASGGNVFVSKIDTSGNFVWAKGFGSTGSDAGLSIAVDDSNYVYTTGYYAGSTDFDPGTGVATFGSSGGYDIFINKLDSTGAYVWTTTMGSTNTDIGNSIVVDANQSIYTTGYFDGTLDFDPSASLQMITSNDDDIFIQKLKQCYNSASTDFQVSCSAITWIDGNTYASSNNTATHTIPNASGCDSIITLNLSITSNTGVDTIVACANHTWSDGITYTASNTSATDTFPNAAGCDSVVTLALTILNSTYGVDTQWACTSFMWTDGNIYTNSTNTPTDTLVNSFGCDSIVTLNLNIYNAVSYTDTKVACDSYTWNNGVVYTSDNNIAVDSLFTINGCDSVVTLNLTINHATTGIDEQQACDTYTWMDGNTYTTDNSNASYLLQNTLSCDSLVTLNLTVNVSTVSTDDVVACDSYTWIDGNTYTASNNTATFTINNSIGCDSVITLDLTINSVDVNVIATDTVLAAVETNADSYQWLDCNANFTEIGTETLAEYVPVIGGDYAVAINSNNCLDTSDCINVLPIGIENKYSSSTVLIYPNPTQGLFFIHLFDSNTESIKLYSALGTLIAEEKNIIAGLHPIQLELKGGIYFVEVKTTERNTVVRLVVE